ncbi:MAG: hemerythrin domain-containing protein [Bacteroidia bacterium]|nr:hemerythrin domain-containing protein [Bacteroidia bacterium]
MHGVLYNYFAEDHNRIDSYFQKAIVDIQNIDMESYDKFRNGLLRHISIEEKIALPAIARLQSGKPSDDAARIRLEHGAIGALLVPLPTPVVIANIQNILEKHNELEEQRGGIYDRLEQLAGDETQELLNQIKNAPYVTPNKYNEKPEVIEAVKRAVERAGYTFIDK